jgi:hypothetical protein
MRLDPAKTSVNFPNTLNNSLANGNSLEPPPRVTRLATPATAINLTIKPLDAIVVSQVEASVVVLVLDLELDIGVARVLGVRAHALGLAGGVVAGEHAATQALASDLSRPQPQAKQRAVATWALMEAMMAMATEAENFMVGGAGRGLFGRGGCVMLVVVVLMFLSVVIVEDCRRTTLVDIPASSLLGCCP